MKFWQQFLFVTLLGVAVAFFFSQVQDIIGIFEAVSNVVIRIGRFVVFPLVFIGVSLGIYRLVSTKHVLRFCFRLLYAVVVLYIVSAFVGILIGLTFVPEPIPPILQEAQVPSNPDVATIFSQIFPHNFFAIFSYQGDLLLPLVMFSVFLGIICYLSEEQSELPLISFFESLWKGLWRFAGFVIGGLLIGMSVLAVYTVLLIRNISELRIYVSLLVMVGLAVGLTVCLIYPLVIMLLKRGHFKHWFAAAVPVMLAAFCSGDLFFCLPLIQKQLHERFKTSEVGTSTSSVMSLLLCRPGTVMLSCICFLVVLRSYSTLEIHFVQILGIVGLSFFTALRLFSTPSGGVLILLSSLSAAYVSAAGGVYLILLPIMMLLHRLAALVDAVTVMLVAIFVDGKESQVLREQAYEKRLEVMLEDH